MNNDLAHRTANDNQAERLCECGCGRSLDGKALDARHATASCRKRTQRLRHERQRDRPITAAPDPVLLLIQLAEQLQLATRQIDHAVTDLVDEWKELNPESVRARIASVEASAAVARAGELNALALGDEARRHAQASHLDANEARSEQERLKSALQHADLARERIESELTALRLQHSRAIDDERRRGLEALIVVQGEVETERRKCDELLSDRDKLAQELSLAREAEANARRRADRAAMAERRALKRSLDTERARSAELERTAAVTDQAS